MKNNNWLKLCLVSAMALIICYGASAQSTNTTDLNQEELAHWYGTYTWLNGLKLTPHTSINQQEFSIQYHKQPEWWDKAFEFLKSNDLNTLQTGRYVIVPDHVTAFVSEGPVKEKEAINWETHANFNDLQYIITGRAEMGITSVR